LAPVARGRGEVGGKVDEGIGRATSDVKTQGCPGDSGEGPWFAAPMPDAAATKEVSRVSLELSSGVAAFSSDRTMSGCENSMSLRRMNERPCACGHG
jgi:hypothetical protein